MRIRVTYFAAARELAGCSSEEIAIDRSELTLQDFVGLLADHKPRLASYLTRMRFALNGEFAIGDASMKGGDEICVLPPVAGGAALAEVREQTLSIDEVVAAVRNPRAGAIALFVGIVRDHHEGKSVERLEYESYRELAEKEMRRILDELLREHPDASIAAVHRVGSLSIGETAVIVAASSPHRDLAFALCRAAIDRIKERVPIWKKEWAPDGTALWINLERDERT